MEKKLRQVTDSIHGTIYLSDLESELISTPYFYRLHDIYQSSTVYMTFPSNRTKRYEHSLGTMALASRMLFSAVTNAETKTRNLLFKKLKSNFLEIAELVNNGGANVNQYFGKNPEIIENLFDEIGSIKDSEDVINYIKGSMKAGEFIDTALDYYQYYPMERITAEGDNVENIFLYRCLLQAVRIVALFHDVGHPPYSHIIEEVLKDLYDVVESDTTHSWVANKVKEFKNCLNPFFSKEVKKAFKCERLYSKASLIDAHPHERIGLGLLSYAINDVVPHKILSTANKETEKEQRLSHILYYITVVEFAFAILTEKDIFFKSFHKLVDGALDSDRLDYIVRDSQNSGVDWGTIPYERIINSAKLFHLEKNNNGVALEEAQQPFVVAYPQKITDDIEDLILVRYKIFARINFHHRCMKTAVALQAAVKELAIDYLINEDDNKCINPDIHILWTALNTRMGNKKVRAIQWNDSWLISSLHKALVYLHVEGKSRHNLLKENLEEILLNKKKYYTLMKRGRDNCRFVEKALKKAGITKQLIQNLKNQEYKKYYTSGEDSGDMKKILSDPKSEALDSIGRISEIFDTLDLEALCNLIPLDGNTLNENVETALQKCGDLTNFAVIINYGRAKNGLPKHTDILDSIYLYKNDICAPYDEQFSLNAQIKAIAKNIPWLYVYFVPKAENCDVGGLTDDLFDLLASSVGEKLQDRFNELFHGRIQSEQNISE